MLQHTKTGDELTTLAISAEEHLREKGHDVKVVPNADATAFEVRPTGSDDMICRAQAIGRDSFEIARVGGETLTGLGDDNALFLLLDRVVADQARKAA